MIPERIAAALPAGGKARRYAARLAIVFGVLVLLGFFVLPPVVRAQLVARLGEALQREVAVERVRFNPFMLSLTVEGLRVREHGSETVVAGFDRLYANFQLSSLLRGGPVVSELSLDGPQLRIVRQPDRRYNFSDLLERQAAPPAADAPLPRFSLANIRVSNGRIDFDDRLFDEQHALAGITLGLPFLSSLPHHLESFVEPAFAATLDGSPIELKGRSKPFADSTESELQLAVDDLQLAQYLDYLPLAVPARLTGGALDSDLTLRFRQAADAPATISLAGSLALKGLALEEADGQALLAFERLDLTLGSLDLPARQARIDRVALLAPVVHARATTQGALNWRTLLSGTQAPPAAPAAAASPAAAPAFSWTLGEASIARGTVHWLDETGPQPLRATLDEIEASLRGLGGGKSAEPATFDLALRVAAGDALVAERVALGKGELDLAGRRLSLGEVVVQGLSARARRAADGSVAWLRAPALRDTPPDDGAAPWRLQLPSLRTENASLRFDDRAVTPSVTQSVHKLALTASGIDTAADAPAEVSLRFGLNRRGDVAASGRIGLAPLTVALALDLKAIELLPLQAYFTDRLNIAVTRGQLALKGDLSLALGETLRGGFRGQATVGDFHAVDKPNSADFLKWKSFHLGGIDARLGPDSLNIAEVALSDFFARVIVSPEGRLNLMHIVRRETDGAGAVAGAEGTTAAGAVERRAGEAAAPLPARASPALPLRIDKVTLQGGSVNFTDNFVKPNYSANLRAIGGSVSGLSSAQDSVATLSLRGSYDDIAPLRIEARLNPLASKPFLDLDADVKGIELTPFSPYSGKYAGYAIEKGKLSLFVKYRIEDQRLTAENRVFLDQLTFGAPVESPSATRLPVTLAVALLKNRRGEIDINLPISGSLDDPEFSVGGLVVKVIVNLFVKAVTSPFALLGSLFGGGEELSFLTFPEGRHTLDAAAQQRLEALARALQDRPALKLEIDGHADPERDREGLKLALLDARVRTLKRDDLVKKGVEAGSADDIAVEPAEYPGLLARVYRAEKFPKPRNLVGFVKDLPVAEMEKLIVTHTQVDEEALRALATRRAQAARDWLVTRGGVPAERIFLRPVTLEARAGAGNGGEAGESRSPSRVDFSLK